MMPEDLWNAHLLIWRSESLAGARASQGIDLLRKMLVEGNESRVRVLLSEGASPIHHCGINGLTVLAQSAQSRQMPIMEAVLSWEGWANLPFQEHRAFHLGALDEAMQSKWIDGVVRLLRVPVLHGLDLAHDEVYNGQSALALAVDYGHSPMVAHLLQAQSKAIDWERAHFDKASLVNCAIRNADPETLGLLLDAGAPWDIPSGDSAWEVAVTRHDAACAELLWDRARQLGMTLSVESCQDKLPPAVRVWLERKTLTASLSESTPRPERTTLRL